MVGVVDLQHGTLFIGFPQPKKTNIHIPGPFIDVIFPFGVFSWVHVLFDVYPIIANANTCQISSEGHSKLPMQGSKSGPCDRCKSRRNIVNQNEFIYIFQLVSHHFHILESI